MKCCLRYPAWGIPWQQNGEIVPTSYLKANRDNVVRLMRATADAISSISIEEEPSNSWLSISAVPAKKPSTPTTI